MHLIVYHKTSSTIHVYLCLMLTRVIIIIIGTAWQVVSRSTRLTLILKTNSELLDFFLTILWNNVIMNVCKKIVFVKKGIEHNDH